MKNISILAAISLLVVSLVLSYLSVTNGTKEVENRDKLTKKYLDKAKEKLDLQETKEAIRFVKLAIQANPKSKDGFKLYEEIIKNSYNLSDKIDTSHSDTKHSISQEDEVDMGC